MTWTILTTTDERFQKVANGEWWDTVGIDLVPEVAVDRHLAENPGVGVMVVRHEDEDA